MSYPTSGAKSPAQLGLPPVPKLVFVNRRSSSSTPTIPRRGLAAHHTKVESVDHLWACLARAATNASAATAEIETREKTARTALPDEKLAALKSNVRLAHPRADERSQEHLWTALDPAISTHSAAVKATVQALNLALIVEKSQEKLGELLSTWLDHALTVGCGMHWLFKAGIAGWDEGLSSDAQSAVLNAETKTPSVPRAAWNPFETYFRQSQPQQSQQHQKRTRVSIEKSKLPEAEKEVACQAWSTACEAHMKMLEMEAHNELFVPDSECCKLAAEEIGGLFLLTSLSDNWPRRTDVFDRDFWTLRIVHFGIERNVRLHTARFSLDVLTNPSSGDEDSSSSSSSSSGGKQLRRRLPNANRSYSCLKTALHTLVTLKVFIFWRIRTHAYDLAEGKPLTTDEEFAATIFASRHDLEESKSHWLATTRLSSQSSSSQSSAGSKKRQDAEKPEEPLPPPPSKRPCISTAEEKEENSSAVMVPMHLALAKMAAERYKLRRRLEVLDKYTGLFLAHQRRAEEETNKLEADVRGRIDALTAEFQGTNQEEESDSDDNTHKKHLQFQEKMASVAADCDISKIRAAVVQRMKRIAATEGLAWEKNDRLWVHDCHHPAVAALIAIDGSVAQAEPAAAERVYVHISYNEYEECFGLDGLGGLYGNAARCEPENGWSRREARALAERLLRLLQREGEFCSNASSTGSSLDALVPLPFECHAEVELPDVDAPVLSGVPEHVKTYTALQKQEADGARAFAAFVHVTRDAMAHAIQQCFYSCLKEASAEKDEAEESNDEAMQAPPSLPLPLHRIHAARRETACDIVHSFLAIAHAYDGLVTVSDAEMEEAAVEEEDNAIVAPIIVYRRDLKRLLMPHPEKIVEQHWQAAQHFLELSMGVKAWVKDFRRRVSDGVLLLHSEQWVTLHPESGLHIRGHAKKEVRVLAKLGQQKDARARKYWPQWPPQQQDLCAAPERVSTALKYGRGAAACAALVAEVKKTERASFPNPPYHNVAISPHMIGAHAYLHRAHAQRVQEEGESKVDSEVDSVDLFGRSDSEE